MTERDTLGYNLGWNIENEYISSLNGIMDSYYAQVDKIDGIIKSMNLVEADVMRNHTLTDEQMRQWYNEDYAENSSLISFEKYKSDILESINQKNQDLRQETSKRYNEYFANLYNLIDIKNETRVVINQRKNELNLLLQEKDVQLSSILLERSRTKVEYDENKNILNSAQLREINLRYDQTFLEINKIKHALQSLDDMFKLVEITQEEKDFMMRGLNPQEREIYEKINGKVDPILDPEPNPVSEPVLSLEDEEELTLDEIIYKVCGDNKFNDRQSSRYAASKIKIFTKPQKDNLGLGYKIVSIPRTIIGIVPRAAMKLYGKFISKATKNTFAEMEERANNLTDKEVEVILNEYKGNIAQSKRIPKGFNNAIRQRVDKYISVRIAQINEQVKQNILKIDYSGKVIKALNEKLETVTNSEMKERINEVINTAYSKAYVCVKDLIELQIAGNNLQCGHGLHSFEEELKALDTKMNYIGGRFSKSREYDPELWSKISGYSQKIEYSLDTREVVDSYLKREEIYKENTKEKRSVLNFGSKVTTGKLDYRPFVESLNYGNDPYIRDLITSILVISSAASLTNNIVDNIKHQQMIDKINDQITGANKVGAEQQQFIEEVRQNGITIEKGIVHDIRRTEGDIENLAERGINSKYDYSLSGSNYVAEDLAHHTETANLSVQNTQEILDLTSKYSNGAITYPELLRGVQGLKENATEMYVDYSKQLHDVISDYAKANPQFDYTAVLKNLEHVIKNPSDSVDMSQLMIDMYERSLNVSDFQSIDLIQDTLNSTDMIPNIITLGSAAAKSIHEDIATKNERKTDSKRAQEIRSLIEDLKSMRTELTDDEKLELEQLISR